MYLTKLAHYYFINHYKNYSYRSPNAETQPRERMHRITTKYPEDPRAPFYNSRSDVMTPLAKLYIRREKVIKRNCDEEILQSQVLDEAENNDEQDIRELAIFEIPSKKKFFADLTLKPLKMFNYFS